MLHHLCSSMGLATMSGLGHPYSPFVTFITQRMGRIPAPSTWLRLWTALSWVVRRPPMPSWFTILGVESITNRTVIALTHIGFRFQSILLCVMTGDYSATYPAMTTLLLRKSTPLVQELSVLTLPRTFFLRGRSWTSLFRLILLVML